MARNVRKIDEKLLSRAAELFQTRTKRDTVRAALRDVVRRARMVELDPLARGELPDFGDPNLLSDAWRGTDT